MRKFIPILLLLVLLLMPTAIQADQDCQEGYWQVNGACVRPDEVSLNAGWNEIVPGGEAMCAFGDPYQFWVRPGSADLLVYFEGGGGCWNAETCEQGSSWYNQTISDAPAQGRRDGIFDFGEAENPFAEHTVVYAPSCTGDVYMGSQFTAYSDEVQVYHHGFINGSAVTDWLKATVNAPASIFVTGCSAGSVGSAIFAPRLIEQYPGVLLRQLGDSLAFVFPAPVELQSDWNAQPAIPAEMEIDAAAFWMPDYYVALAQQYPEQGFAMYNTQYDDVQVRYYIPGEMATAEFAATLNASLEQIEAAAPNFYSFTAGGGQHCILGRDNFYTYAADGVRLVEWVSAYARGEMVESIHCDNCDQAEQIRR